MGACLPRPADSVPPGGDSGARDAVLPRRVAVIGTGLIGGSLGLALRRLSINVAGYDLHPPVVDHALERGAVDTAHGTLAAAVCDAEFVALCVPPAAQVPLLGELTRVLAPRAVVCDTGSIKRQVTSAAHETLGPAASRFVPAHPIAGREFSGVAAATEALYRGCRVILTPAPGTEASAVRAVEQVWYAVGAAIVQHMDAQRHDTLLAACSHLPHLLAFALVDYLAGQKDAEELFRCAAGGFADFTRIAASDPALWLQISLANRDLLAVELQRYAGQLVELAKLLSEANAGSLEAVLDRAAAARRRYVDPRQRTP